MTDIVGIDLGTTFSAVAYVRNGVPEILPNGRERIGPSVVGFSPQGELLVGAPARNQYILYPELTVRSIKRKMGTDETITLGSHTYTPAEISAIILREMKRIAEANLGHAADRAVITVPAYFSDAARQATKEAGEIAGFTVERIINEPTAAALAYGLDRLDERQVVAVYDLGGGTFDVSIVEFDGGVVEVRASHGNTRLGGDDFDELLADYLAEEFEAEHGTDPRQDRRALARLLRAAEAAKIELSSRAFAQVRQEYLIEQDGRPLHLNRELARTELEDLIRPLIVSTLDAFDQALEDAHLQAGDLDKVLFVGGSTRIPLVWEMVADHVGLEPHTEINPDEAVALGAGVQAAIIAGEPVEAILVDVMPHSVGIEVADIRFGQVLPDKYNPIIHRNTTIPTSKSEVYYTLHPAQTAIELKVYQGEDPVASRNTLLGEYLFEHLKPEAPGELARVTVQFDVDVNGILHVTATDRGSGRKAEMTVTTAHERLSATQIEAARAHVEAMTTAGPEVTALLTRARRTLESEREDLAELQAAVAELEAAVREGRAEEQAALADDLADLLYDMEE
ncbi:MAG: Hsp70 family protein [Anaerolineae bacterium]